MKNPKCHKCKYHESIPGDAHFQCLHPEIKKNPEVEAMAILGIARTPSPSFYKLNIELDPHGVKNGWATWPVNFDPIWIKNCDGFLLEDSHEK